METISFEIMGDRVAQGRPRAGKTFNGNTVLYNSAKSRDFKHYVKLVSSQHKPQELITGPVHLEMTFLSANIEKVSHQA